MMTAEDSCLIQVAQPGCFDSVGEDLLLSIFSFLADAPLLEGNCNSSEKCLLTGVIPEVSKLWRNMSDHDFLWKPLILQQLAHEPGLWIEGLWKLTGAKQWDLKVEIGEPNDALVQHVRTILGKITYKSIYRQVLEKHIRFTGPVFYMRGHVLLGESYRLHMFEPRYRLLVADLMKYYSEEARRGGKIVPGATRPPPLFIHANRDSFSSSTPACLVQILRCSISCRDGTADVLLLPIAYVWMEKTWVVPDCFNLHCAQALRMGSKATREMHELVNRETLESVMGRVAGYEYTDTSDEEFDEMGSIGWD